MARLIVNKFFDKHEDAKKGFTTDNNYMFGEIVICNDSNNPCIYIKDNDQLSRGIGQISVKTDDNILTKTKNGVISASLSLVWDRITNSIQLLGKDQKVISSISVFDDNDDSVSDAIVNNIQRVIDVVYNNEDSKLIFTTFKNGETKTIEVKLDIEGKDYVSVNKIDNTYVVSIDTETDDGIATKKWAADYYDDEFNNLNETISKNTEKIEQLSEFDNKITEQLEEKLDIIVYETNIEEINKQIENNKKTIDEKLDSAIYENFHNEYMKVKEQVDYFFDLKYDEEEEGEEDESKIDTLKEIVDWISGADGETIGDLSKEIKENKAAIDSHTQQINDINKALEDTIDKNTYENDKNNFNQLLQNKVDVLTYQNDNEALHKKIDTEISIRETTDNEINQTLNNKVNIDDYNSYKENINNALDNKVDKDEYNSSIIEINKNISQNAEAIETLREVDSNFTNIINGMETTISGHTEQISQLSTSLNGKVDGSTYQSDKESIEKSISDNTKLIDTKVDKEVYNELFEQYSATKQEVDYFFNDNAEINKTVDTLKEIAHWLEGEEGETASDLAKKIAANAKAIETLQATDNEINQNLNNKVNINEYNEYKENVNQALNDKVNTSDYSNSITEINKNIQKTNEEIENAFEQLDTKIDSDEYASKMLEIEELIETKVSNSDFNSEITKLNNSISGNTKLISDNTEAIAQLEEADIDIYEKLDDKVEQSTYYSFYNDYVANKNKWDDFLGNGNDISVEHLNKAIETLREADSNFTNIINGMETTISGHTEQISQINTSLDGKVDNIIYQGDKESIEKSISGNTKLISDNTEAIEQLEETFNKNLATKVDITTYTEQISQINASLDSKVDGSTYQSDKEGIEKSISDNTEAIEQLKETFNKNLATKVDITTYTEQISQINTSLDGKVDGSTYQSDKEGIEKSISDNTEAIAQLEEVDIDIYGKLDNKVEESIYYSFYNDYITNKNKWDDFLGGTSGDGNEISVEDLNKAIETLREADSNFTNTINGMQTTISGHTEQISQINTSLNYKVDNSTYQSDKESIEKSISGNTKLISSNTEAIAQLEETFNVNLATKVDSTTYNTAISQINTSLNGKVDKLTYQGDKEGIEKSISDNTEAIVQLEETDIDIYKKLEGKVEQSTYNSFYNDYVANKNKWDDFLGDGSNEGVEDLEELQKRISQNAEAIETLREADSNFTNTINGIQTTISGHTTAISQINASLDSKVDGSTYQSDKEGIEKSISGNTEAIEQLEETFNSNLATKVDIITYTEQISQINTSLNGKVGNTTYQSDKETLEKGISDNAEAIEQLEETFNSNLSTKVDITTYTTAISQLNTSLNGKVNNTTYQSDKESIEKSISDNTEAIEALQMSSGIFRYDLELQGRNNSENFSLLLKENDENKKEIIIEGEQNITLLNSEPNKLVFQGPDLTEYVTNKVFEDSLKGKADETHNQASSTITDAITTGTGITSTAPQLVQGKAVYEYAAKKEHGHDDYYSKDDVNGLLNKKADTEHSQNSSTITDAITTGTGITSGATELVQGKAVYEYAAKKEHGHGDTYAAKEHGHGKISFEGDVDGEANIEHNGCKVSLTVISGENHTHVSSGITDAITIGTGITSTAKELVKGKAVYEYAAKKEHGHGDTYAAKEHGHGNIILTGGVTGDGKISGDNNIEINTTVIPSGHTHNKLKILQNGVDWKTYNGSEDVEINLITPEIENGSNVNVSPSLTSGYEIAKITVDNAVHTLYGKEALPLTGGKLETTTSDTPLTLKSTYKDKSCWLAFHEKDGWTLSIGTNCSTTANSNSKSLMLYDGTNTRTLLDNYNHSESKHLPSGATNNQLLTYDGKTNTPIWKDITNIVKVNATVDSNVGTPNVTTTLTGTDLNFEFKNLKGDKGDTGNGIAEIRLISPAQQGSAISQDIYRITYTNSTYFDFVVTNGSKGDPGTPGDDGAAGSNGYSMYYTTTEYASTATSIPQSNVTTNSRTLQIGDLILSKNGNLFKISKVATNLTVAYVFSLKGATGATGGNGSNGYSMYYTTTEYSTGQISIPQSNVTTNGRTLQVGDLILSKNGNVFKISKVATNLTVAYVFSLKGAAGASASITGATATVDANVGKPSVTVTPTGTDLKRGFAFDFKNLKGDKGDPGGNGTSAAITGATATVDANVGTPSVTVTPTGTDLKRGFKFDFKNLKGEKGSNGSNGYSMYYTSTNYTQGIKSIPQHDVTTNNRALQVGDLIISVNGNVFKISNVATNLTVAYVFSLKGGNGTSASITGATATVDSNVGTPSVTVTPTGTELKRGFKFDFKNLKGDNGDPGDDGRSVKEVVCVKSSSNTETTTPSTADGGTSYYKIKDTNGNWLEGTIAVKNGSKGSSDDATTVTDENVKSTVDNKNIGYLLASTASGTTTGTAIKNSNHYISGDTLYVKNLESNNEVYGVEGYFDYTWTEALDVEGDINISNGGIVSGATAYYQTSDERMKEFGDDIEIDFEKLKEIPKKYFTWKSDDSKKLDLGTSAQKVREIYPELVGGDDDSTLSVDYAKLSVIALKAVDKLHEENEMLRTELDMIKKHLGL